MTFMYPVGTGYGEGDGAANKAGAERDDRRGRAGVRGIDGLGDWRAVGPLPDKLRLRAFERVHPAIKHNHIHAEALINLRQLRNLPP